MGVARAGDACWLVTFLGRTAVAKLLDSQSSLALYYWPKDVGGMMTTGQLLRQLNRQLMDLRYRERRALAWTRQGEQNKLYALGALSVIQSEIGDIVCLIEQLEREGISDEGQVCQMTATQSTYQDLST